MQIQPAEDISDEIYIDYFLNRNTSEEFKRLVKSDAKNINNIFDIYKYAFFNDITNSAGLHYTILGAKIIQDTILLEDYKDYTYSIPPELQDYILLSYHYNPVSNVQIYPIITRDVKHPDTSIHVYPYKKDSTPANSISLTITLVAISKAKKQDIITTILLDAFKYYMQKEYRYAIIAAQNAYELSAKRFFMNLSGQERFKPAQKFLSEMSKENISAIALKYLPLLVSLTDKPMPPTVIQKSIIDMTSMRNKMSHDLKQSNTIVKRVKSGILSAFFMCKYFELEIPIKDYPKESYISSLPETKDIDEADRNAIISIFR